MAQFVKLLYVPYYVLFCLLIAVANRGVSVEFRFSMDCFTGCIIFVSTAFSLFYRSGADQWGLWSLSVYVMPVLSMADCLWVFRPILRHWGPFETLQWSISVRCWWHATLNHQSSIKSTALLIPPQTNWCQVGYPLKAPGFGLLCPSAKQECSGRRLGVEFHWGSRLCCHLSTSGCFKSLMDEELWLSLLCSGSGWWLCLMSCLLLLKRRCIQAHWLYLSETVMHLSG